MPGAQLAAPPGYVGYTASPMSSVPLKRVGGIGKAAVVLVAATGALNLLTFLAGTSTVDDAQALLDGEITREAFAESMITYGLLGVLQGAATLASAIVVMIWMHRIASNHRTLHRVGTWGPGWAIGGWFLLPFVYVIPFLMFRELWKASDPDVPLGAEWRSGPVAPIVTAWFLAFGPVSLAVLAASGGSGFSLDQDERSLAQGIVDGQAVAAVSAVVAIVSAGLFVAMARQLDARHRRLTGEQ